MDRTIAQSVRAQLVQMFRRTVFLFMCHQRRMFAQRGVHRGQTGPTPIRDDGMDEIVCRLLAVAVDLGPEVVCMRLRSVETIHFRRHYRGE